MKGEGKKCREKIKIRKRKLIMVKWFKLNKN